ncbi:hypothetical protein L596_002363 [Steinernema carpocapsae]|uniref:MULE transposase domain-containing protein n=1 Tax=Steinernema carpocapsae TaxID=34508 RepID=A0A4U8UP31_STECR|nr:hypothetical protein L596_002363 [Steinernema carpocapsae]
MYPSVGQMIPIDFSYSIFDPQNRDLHLAAHSDVIVCDATFKTSPNKCQVLGLHARMFNKDNEYEWFTFAFAPICNKLSLSYEFICKTIKEAWIRLECGIDKPKFRVDFEGANYRYFLHIWPE